MLVAAFAEAGHRPRDEPLAEQDREFEPRLLRCSEQALGPGRAAAIEERVGSRARETLCILGREPVTDDLRVLRSLVDVMQGAALLEREDRPGAAVVEQRRVLASERLEEEVHDGEGRVVRTHAAGPEDGPLGVEVRAGRFGRDHEERQLGFLGRLLDAGDSALGNPGQRDGGLALDQAAERLAQRRRCVRQGVLHQADGRRALAERAQGGPRAHQELGGAGGVEPFGGSQEGDRDLRGRLRPGLEGRHSEAGGQEEPGQPCDASHRTGSSAARPQGSATGRRDTSTSMVPSRTPAKSSGHV